ncbi:hypothetical protein P40081_31230 [Paenibacillus sp. FSL P4-0081]|nr:hypothetical protein P40081_31230 [Paenibacillus sp. FSL P4-0081]
MDHFLWNLKQVRLKDKLVLVSGIPLNPRKPETWEIKGINPFDSAESGRYEEIRGINPSADPAGRRPKARMSGKSAPESAESGRQAGKSGKSAPEGRRRSKG